MLFKNVLLIVLAAVISTAVALPVVSTSMALCHQILIYLRHLDG